MLLFFYLLIFVFGLIIGSFLNCVIYRLEVDESLTGNSYCPKCKHFLRWYDLIPVLSFVFLKGKCRYCQKSISWQYPLVELATGIIFVLIFNQFSIFNFQNFLFSIFYFLLSSFLIIIFIYDLKHYIIPDKIIYPAIGITFIYQLFRSLGLVNWNLFGIWNLEFGILAPILSAILASGFFLIIVLFSRGQSMGVGDIKLAFLMGLILGWPNILVALFFAFFTGAIIGVGLIFLRQKTLKSEVPFAPFLITGTFFALFWGEKIINWYWYFSLFLLI